MLLFSTAQAQFEIIDDPKHADLSREIANQLRCQMVKIADDYLSLSQQQCNALSEVYKKLENDELFDIIDEDAFYCTCLGMLPELDDSFLKLLSPKQRRVLEKAELLDSLAEGSDEQPVLKRLSTELVDLRIEQLTKCCDLTDSQIRKLKAVAAICIRRANDERLAHIELDQANIETLDSIRYMYCPPLYRCLRQPIWKKTLNFLLTPNQRAKYEESQQWRREANTNCVIQGSLFCVGINYVDSLETYNSLAKLIRNEISVEPGDHFDGMIQFLEMDTAILAEIYKDKEFWAEIEPDIDAMHQTIIQLRSAGEE